MDTATVILITLVVYKVLLLGIGWAVSARNQTSADYFLGGRKLGPLVAAISASASSSSVWTLLGVSGWAYTKGLSAVWFLPSCIGGFAINWFVVAPRMQRMRGEAVTLTEFLAGPDQGTPSERLGRRLFVILASVAVMAALLLYVAAQMGGAGKTFTSNFPELDGDTSIIIGGLVVLGYTLLGGFWAVSITDTIQGLLMALTAVLLPAVALVEVGGVDPLWEGIQNVVDPIGYGALVHPSAGGAASLGFVVGILGIGIGYPGQPHVVNRFMALEDRGSLRRARVYAMSWAALVYAGMVTLGLCGRVLLPELPDGEAMFFKLAVDLLPTVIAGVMVAAILSAIMSTADSQLLVAGSVVSHDLGWEGKTPKGQVLRSRLVVAALTCGAVGAALTIEKSIFDQVLSAWSCLGAGFGPLLLVTLWVGPPHPWAAVAALVVGFGGAVWAYAALGSSIHWHVTVTPWLAALGIAWVSAAARKSRRRLGE